MQHQGKVPASGIPVGDKLPEMQHQREAPAFAIAVDEARETSNAPELKKCKLAFSILDEEAPDVLQEKLEIFVDEGDSSGEEEIQEVKENFPREGHEIQRDRRETQGILQPALGIPYHIPKRNPLLQRQPSDEMDDEEE
ncbi:unnamed protein product, partial [Cyprideis torosa]